LGAALPIEGVEDSHAYSITHNIDPSCGSPKVRIRCGMICQADRWNPMSVCEERTDWLGNSDSGECWCVIKAQTRVWRCHRGIVS
jgi:hypothetical protein